MKIVFAISGLTFGGAQRVVSVLANEMAKEHDVTVILTSGESEICYPLESAVHTVCLPGKKNVVANWMQFRKICKKIAPDAVFAFMDVIGIFSSLFLLGTGIPVIFSERNDPSEKSRKMPFHYRLLNLLAKRNIAGYVFQSAGAQAYYPKAAQKRSAVILNPLDVENLPVREESGVENRVVTMGRLHRQKNQKLLIEAFAESRFAEDSTLHIYGEGGLRKELEQLIREKNLTEKVFLEGASKTVLEEIKNAALFVFTSDYEGLPNALAEAMAIGIPSISTDCSPGGARMLVEDGKNGLLVPCRDKGALVDAMNKLHDSPALREALGKEGKHLREKLEIRQIAARWLNFAEKVRKGDRKWS